MPNLSMLREQPYPLSALAEPASYQSVLELGCGAGRELALLAAESEATRCVGIDRDYLVIEKCRTRWAQVKNMEFMECSAEQIAHRSMGQFDLVLSIFGAMQFANDPQAVLAATRSVLRPAGRLIVANRACLLDGDDSSNQLRQVDVVSKVAGVARPAKAWVGVQSAWADLALKEGFKVESSRHIGGFRRSDGAMVPHTLIWSAKRFA